MVTVLLTPSSGEMPQAILSLRHGFLSTYYVPGIALDIKVIPVNKKGKNPAFLELPFCWENRIISK